MQNTGRDTMANPKNTIWSEKKIRKAINFDLDTHKLRTVYGEETNYTAAYHDIERFFNKLDFEHRQGSGYCSKNKLSDMDIFYSAEDMNRTLPWMKDCVKNIDVTDIGPVYSLNFIFESDAEVEQEIKKETEL